MKFWTMAFILLLGLGLSACGSEATDEEGEATDSTATENTDSSAADAGLTETETELPEETPIAAPTDFEAVAKDFIQAKARLNFAKAKEYVSGRAVGTLNQVEKEMAKLPAVLKKKFKTATVDEIQCQENGETVRICQACCNTKGNSYAPVRLVLKNGEWKVDAF